jgi:AcrR family transcriptional regulator
MTRDLPRSVRSDAVRNAPPGGGVARIMRAAIEVTVEDGLAGLSADSLCRHASVTRAEFDQHWSDPLEALCDALDERLHLPQLPDTGNLQDDLAAYAEAYLRRLSDPAFVSCLVYVMAQSRSDRPLGRRLQPDYIRRRAANRVLIERAVARGELPPGADPDHLLDGVLGLGLGWLSSSSNPTSEEIRSAVQQLLARHGRYRAVAAPRT